MVAAAIRTIFAQPDAAHVRSQLDVIAGMLGRQFPKVETLLRDAADELTAFAAFPASHWKKIWSTNPVRHEALLVRGGGGSPSSLGRRWVVAAACRSWGQPGLGGAGRWVGAAPTTTERVGTVRRPGSGK
jgi:hypothetical protein